MGGRHIVEPEGQGQKKIFWTSTCAGYCSIIVVETHTLRYSTWYTCHERLTHTPYLTSATAVSWRKLQKTTSPGTLHGHYPQQGCGPVNTITLGTAIGAECPADKKPTGLYICPFDRTY